MPAPVWAALGGGLVVLVAIDIVTTVLHPTLQGPLTQRALRLGWRLAAGVSRRLRRPALLSAGGPLAILTLVGTWVVGIWLGFALVYLPWIAEGFSYTPSVVYGDKDLFEALYVSGTLVTTVGLGDVVPQGDALRILAVVEAGAGLATFTAAITYLINVYPLISEARATALVAGSAAPDAERATRLVIHGGQAELGQLQRGLVKFREDTNRFPILFYFRSSDPSESFLTLLHGAALVCLELQWGLNAAAVPYAPIFGTGLQDALERVVEDYQGRFAGHDLSGRLDAQDAQARFARLREAAEQVAPDAAADACAPPREFCELVGTLDALLEDLARWQRYPHRPLLCECG